jgi:hypothetical protein
MDFLKWYKNLDDSSKAEYNIKEYYRILDILKKVGIYEKHVYENDLETVLYRMGVHMYGSSHTIASKDPSIHEYKQKFNKTHMN